MTMQTRSMTRRAGVPHDLEAFNSYKDEDIFEPNLPERREMEWDEESSYEPSEEDEEEEMWPDPVTSWTTLLSTYRSVFTRSQWRAYIEEIADTISELGEDADSELTYQEYHAVYAFMHGKF